MRSILLHVHEDECLEARLQVALDLARRFDGHLTCLQVMALDLAVPGDMYGTMIAELLPVLREAAEALRERVEGKMAAEDVAWDWVQEMGSAGERLLRRCGLSDVVVLGSCDPVRGGPSALVGSVVLHARTPVLVVPPHVRQFDATGPAVVAWDGSLEASHALRAAIPILAKARSVHLVSVLGERGGEEDFDLPPTEGAEFLSRHGIACEMTDLPFRDSSIAQGLARAAAEREASCLVMGAYGHPRLLETIWGGVSRELLSEPPLPIFACH